MKATLRFPLVTCCGLVGSFCLILPAANTWAQAAETTAPVTAVTKEDVTKAGGKTTPEMIVTGTRIIQPNLVSSSPINMVSDQEIKLQGATQVSDILNNLPQQFNVSGIDFSSTSNPLSSPGGLSTADLRGLGPQRTLVLVNGRRLGVGDANTGNPNPAPDLNQIPAQLIERVDVVTGGASAVYGSDAVAGVVNFIMKRNFEGIEIDGQYGFAQHTNDNSLMRGLLDAQGFPKPESDVLDGRNKELAVVAGANSADGNANATVYFTWREAQLVSQGSRDFSACKLNVNASVSGGPIDTPVCSGSPNSNEFNEVNNAFDLTQVGAFPNNQFLPWPQAGSSPPPLFNSNAYQVLSAPDERYTAGLLAHDQFTEKVDAYIEFSFMNDRALTAIAPSGLFLGGNPYNATGGQLVNCDNPLLSTQEHDAIGCAPGSTANVDMYIGRRNIEGGPRTSEYEHENYRAVFGLKGDLGQGWNYDTYFQYYYTSLFQSNNHYLSSAAINKALQVVDVGGVPTCKSKVDGTDSACVPYNIFAEGGVTPDQVAYLDSLGTEYGTVQQRIIAGSLTNDLGQYGIKSPWAANGVGIAVGVEHRYEALKWVPDKATGANDLSGFAGAATAIDGSYNVTEEYIEARVPIIQDRPFFEDLVFESGYRYSDYSTAGGVSTYKFGVQWAPVRDARFRAIWNRAIRAPNIIELFNPQTVTNTNQVASDPCAGAAPTASLADCMNTGVTALQYGSIAQCPAGQCATLQGGNPDLKPEEADTYTVGVTLTPTFLPDFSASIDYYHVDLKDVVSNVPLPISLANCLAGQTVFCSNIVRTSTGALFGTTIGGGGYIKGTSVNIAQEGVSGIDFQANYRLSLPTGWGQLMAGFTGAYQDTQTTITLPGQPEYDCSGLYGQTCQSLNPKWRHILRLSWEMPWNVTASVQWRYIDSVDLETNSSQSELNNGVIDVFNATLDSVSYVDLSGFWEINHIFTLRAGINNLLDQDPPLVSSLIAQTGSPNTYPTYDLLGRVFFIGLNAKF